MPARVNAATAPGQHIYAYCHTRTKQVLYSLDRNLQPSDLKQLPDIGANFTPPSLRKDEWRPLWSVHLPPTPQGRAQGLHAFKKLREWRKLHETRWELPDSITRPYTEKEIEVMKKALEDRGGSKKESVYDVIKRKKHNMRAKEIMNQKYNSVADLAAVLLEQDSLGLRTAEEKAKLAEEDRRVELKQMRELAALAEADGVARLRKEIVAMEDARERTPIGSRSELRRQLNAKKRQLQRLEWVAQVVASAKEFALLPEAQREREADYWEEMIGATESPVAADRAVGALASEYQKTVARGDWQQLAVAARAAGLKAQLRHDPLPSQMDDAAHEQGSGAEDGIEAASVEVDYTQFWPSFPTELDPYTKTREHAPARGWLRHEIKKRSGPVYSAEGVTVRWANIMDAEFAESWPDVVKHERMGFARFEHPKPPKTDAEESYEPIDNVSEFKALQWKKRAANWEMEPSLLEKVRARRAEMGLLEDPLRPGRLQEGEEIGDGFAPSSNAAAANTGTMQSKQNLPDAQQAAETEVQDSAAAVEKVVEQRSSVLEAVQQELMTKVEQQARAGRWNRRADKALWTAKSRLRQATAGALGREQLAEQSSPSA